MPAQNPCVLIATPTRGSPKMQYVQSLIGTIKDLARRKIPSDFEVEEGSNLTLQRSVLASRFLKLHQFTHLFFIDDDMIVPHDLCARLLASDKPIVGTVATPRNIDLNRAEKAMSLGIPFRQALLVGHDWIVVSRDNDTAPLRKVESLGFGAVLIRRDALSLMVEKGAVRRYSLLPGPVEFYGFFATRGEDEWAGEDRSFYRRWQIDCRGEIWALTDVPIMHIGDFAYGGRYSDLPR
jgi:hypothetical protein